MAEGGDPTFYRSPAAAGAAPPEQLAYVAAFDPEGRQNDAMTVVDCDAGSSSDGPGGVALIDHDTFEVTGAWETDRGEQYFGYDVWWHLNNDVAITSEWGTPSMIENGLNPDDLLGRRFGHHLNFWSLSEGKLMQRIDLGDEHQMVLEMRPAHDPRKTWGFVGVVISVADLSASVWLWHRENGDWEMKKVITIPAEPADASELPPALQPFAAVPPLVTDID